MSVYFFHRDRDGLVKIGCTRFLDTRISMLRPACGGGELIASISGYFVRERWLHRHFANDRVTGEWFRTSVELKTYMDEAAETGDIAAVPHEPVGLTMQAYDHLRKSLGVKVKALAAMQPVNWNSLSSAPADSTIKQIAYLDLLAIQFNRARLVSPDDLSAISTGRYVTVKCDRPVLCSSPEWA